MEARHDKKIAGMALGGLVMVIVFGYLTAMALTELVPAAMTGNWAGLWNPGLFLKGSTWLYGLIVSVMVFMLYLVSTSPPQSRPSVCSRAKTTTLTVPWKIRDL